MREIMKYVIHSYDEVSELQKRVNWALEEGYELVGGLTAATRVHNQRMQYSQAMLKKDKL